MRSPIGSRRGVAGLSLASAVLSVALGAQAATWRSVVVPAAVLYDAPSVRADKVGIAPKGMPVDVLTVVEPFAKVRDPSGDVQWVERRALGEQRTVVATVLATVRLEPRDTAPTAFQAERGVVLELVEAPAMAGASAGWARIRHRDGIGGWVRTAEVWGI